MTKALIQNDSSPLPPSPLKNHKNIGFLGNTGTDPLKITKPAFNVGPSSAGHSWRADDCQLIMVFGSSLPSITKIDKR